MIGLLLAAQLAAGGVLDVGITSEARASHTELVESTDANPAIDGGSLVLRPSLNGAVEGEIFVMSAGYTPSLSLVNTLSEPAPELTLLHVAQLGGELRLDDRLTFRSVVVGSYGDLDAVTAQSLFQGSSSARGLAVTPFASIAGNLGATMVLVRRLTVDVDGRVEVATAYAAAEATAPAADAPLDIPLTVSPGLDATLAWQITRADALLGGAALRASSVAGRGFFVGGGPVVGWRRQLLRQTGFELTGGVGAYSASDDELSPIVVYIPTAQGRISTLLDLAGDAALEAGAQAGFNVINDPLGTLIENRGAIGVDAGVRVTRNVAIRGAVTAAMPAFAYAQRGRTSSSTYGADLLVAWVPSSFIELRGGFTGTTRIFEGEPVSDVQLAISLTSRAPVLHTGGRPAGSGGNATSIGVTQIGARPPPGKKTIKEVEPLPAIEDEPPPELVPPPGVLPADAAASDSGADGGAGSKLRPLTDQEKRELEKKKKKEKKAEEAADDADEDAKSDDDAKDAKDDDKKGDDQPKDEAKPEG